MKIYRHIDKPLFIVTVLLFIFGLVMVFSSSNVTAYMTQQVSPYNYFIKQGLFLVFGFILFLFMTKFNSRAYGIFGWGLLIICIVSLACLLIYGKAKNQAISWYDLGFISIQPSEFVKVIIIAWMACYYDQNKNNLKTYGKCLFPIGIALIPAVLIFLQPDLGTTIIFCAIVGLIFLIVPMKKDIKFKTCIVIGGIVVIAGISVLLGSSLLEDRQSERLDFMNPCDKILDTGNQVCNCYIAINNGGLTGVGLGNSTQKYLYLPEPYTDFIFAIIVEELGVIVGVLLIVLYAYVVYRILKIGRKSVTNRGTIICYGVACYIVIHIVVNLLGIMGLIPLTGVPLPFMSYGGSFTICLIAALSMVQRISIETGLSKKRGG